MLHWAKCSRFDICLGYCLIVLVVYSCNYYCWHIIFYSLKCNNKHKNIIDAAHYQHTLTIVLVFNPSNKCDADIMEKHYTKYGDRMEQIYRNLYDKLTPECYVGIAFEHGHVSMFHFSNGIDEMESNWDPSEEKDRLAALSMRA